MAESLARWQFAITSIYHFLFVPVTIGLAFLVALLQSSWYRHEDPVKLRLTKFFGTLLVINVAIGVVTGLVQEFEFGMNWSNYSREVGNIFGGPLAMEGLLAFFLESTFLGVWIFGWDRLSKKVHLASIWAVSVATMLSAAFIMAANSWMQHPVGYVTNAVTGQPQLNDIFAIFTNPVFLWSYIHVLLAALVTAALVMLAASAWQLRKRSNESFVAAGRLAIVVLVPAVILSLFVGSELGVIEAKYQPMKIAAAEAQWNTCPGHCSFSLFQIGGGNNDQTPTQIIQIPSLLSILATNSTNGSVEGLNQLQAQDVAMYGPGNYIPNVFIQYWSMRVMAYLAMAILAIALWGTWLIHRRKLADSKVFLWIATWAVILPFLVNTAGWMLAENGRQPWIVQNLMLTSKGVSPSVSSLEVWISLIGFVGLFAVFAVVDAFLMIHYSRRSLEEADATLDTQSVGAGEVPELVY